MAAAEGDTDEDVLARGRGMVVAGRSISDWDDNAEDVVEPNQQRGAALTGRKRGAPRRPPPRTLAAIIEFCRLVNAFIARQSRDRVNGRFWSSSEEFREALSMLTSADQDHLSDGDYVAVVWTSGSAAPLSAWGLSSGYWRLRAASRASNHSDASGALTSITRLVACV